MAITPTSQPQPDLLTSLRNLRRDRAAGIQAPIAAAQSTIAGPPGGSLGDLQRTATAMRGMTAGPGTGGGAAQSNVGETLERSAAQEQLAGVQRAADVASRESALAEQATAQRLGQEQRETQLDELSFAEKAASEQSRLLESAREAKEQGRLDRFKAAVDQADILRRLSNEKYVQQLQQQGQLSRLGDANAFRDSLQNAVFAEENQTLQDYLGWKEIMASDDRAFNEKLSQIDLNTALELSKRKITSAQAQAGFEGLSGAISAGAKGWENYKPEASKPTQATPESPSAPGATVRGGSTPTPF